MKQLLNIKDDLNVANLERKLQVVLDLVCDRMSEDEEAENIFARFNKTDLASHAREFQDFNYIVSSTLKVLVDGIDYTVRKINESIEKALSEQSANLPDNAQQ
ncbi:hypothetical protein N9R04_07210 [Staphylococcus sp. SQ8-PEA]|uniref:Uncharacterized protein n=1 Tax=Staphylococcus marylandisciuri TaxID=2981529 RepID=A0ABT2QR98_9STAP|nr:hypothetical protein [Staphylococcus marylandisciuri]MCU5746506.1 hypothetical protein [Staphylococcus marylandisciuri]